MSEMVLYGIGFFLITLLIQFLLSERNCRKNKQTTFWTGSSAIITICVLGIIDRNIHYLAAILGFVIADEIGKSAGWHK